MAKSNETVDSGKPISMADEALYRRFIAFLRRRQRYATKERNVRSVVDEWRGGAVSIGFPRRYLNARFGQNILSMFPGVLSFDDDAWGESDRFLVSGSILPPGYHSHPGCVRSFETIDHSKSVMLMETGYLASAASWTASFDTTDPRYACLGYVYDDMAHYFMADFPNRIVEKLNSAASLTGAERERAERAMELIVSERISKYNNQPFTPPVFSSQFSRRVLVVDQAFADASTIHGKADETVFQDMLLAAIRDNPEAEIIVKTHPDSLEQQGRREGFYSGMVDTDRVRFLRRPMNPYVLFDSVDRVYVATSQMGFEAILAGKQVVCFGAPIYAGWGFTEDRRPVPHRHRSRTPLEFFHFFYIWYTRYCTPESEGEASIEEVLDYIIRNRPYQPIPAGNNEQPEVSVIIPVHGVEMFLEECIGSVQAQSLKNIEIIAVNDSSPDGSQAILDRLASSDPRLRSIELARNVGQGFARNRALDSARGRYLFFIDGDDYLADRELLQRLVEMADADRADMVRVGKSYELVERRNRKNNFRRDDVAERYFAEVAHGGTFADLPALLHSRHFWNFLYRRSLIEDHGIRFTTTQWEERAFVLKALLAAQSVSMSPDGGIAYRVRRFSTARRKKAMRDVENYTANFKEVMALFVEQGAADREHPLNYHFRFTFSQYVFYVFLGFPYQSLEEDRNAKRIFLERWSEILRGTGLTSADLTADPDVVKADQFAEGVHALIVEAALADQFDLIEAAIEQRPIPSGRMYELYRRNDNEALVSAVNRYAQHHVGLPSSGIPSLRRRSRGNARVVIHVGASKTGSSFVQHLLDQNRPALLRQGIWAPEFGIYRQPGRPHKIGGHSQFFKSARQNNSDMRNALESGLEQLGPDIHTVVISSEGCFLSEGTDALADYLADHNPELLLYLRRQDDWANSQYAEFAAGGALTRTALSAEEWLARPWTRNRLDYERFLRRWMEKLPRDRMYVRAVERKDIRGPGILGDFIDRIGADPSGLVIPDAEMRNQLQLGRSQVAFIRSFNSLPFVDDDSYLRFVERAHAVFRERAAVSPVVAKGSILSNAQRQQILDQAAEGNAWVAREFLGREDGVLFADLEIAPEEAVDEAELHAEDVAAIVGLYDEIAATDSPTKPVKAGKGASASRQQSDRSPTRNQKTAGKGAAKPQHDAVSEVRDAITVKGRYVRPKVSAIRQLPRSQVAMVGLLLAEGEVDPAKLAEIKQVAASQRMSKSRMLSYILRRYGQGVFRAGMPIRERIRLMFRV